MYVIDCMLTALQTVFCCCRAKPPDPGTTTGENGGAEELALVQVEPRRKKPGLLDMPDKVMGMIYDSLDYREILVMRKVCQKTRLYLSGHAHLQLTELYVECGAGVGVMMFNNDERVQYSGDDEFALVKGSRKETFFYETDYQKLFLKDLSYILLMQKRSAVMTSIRFVQTPNISRRNYTFIFEILSAARSALEYRERSNKICVQSLTLSCSDEMQICDFLMWFDYETIKRLEIFKFNGITDSIDEMCNEVDKFGIDQLSQLVQWRHLVEVTIKLKICSNDSIQAMLRFPKASMVISYLTWFDIMPIFQACMEMSQFIRFEVFYKSMEAGDLTHMLLYWKEPARQRYAYRQWFFQKSPSQLLCVFHNPEARKMIFSITDLCTANGQIASDQA